MMKEDFFGLSKEEEQRAKDMHQKAVVIDALGFLPPAPFPSTMRSGKFFRRIREEGLTFSLYSLANQGGGGTCTFREAMNHISDWHYLLQRFSDDLQSRIVKSTKDIFTAKEQRKVAVGLVCQDPKMIEDNLGLLTIFNELGCKVFSPAYNLRGVFADGVSEPTNAGLSILGRKVIEELNRLHMIIDLSHVGSKSSSEALDLSKDPIIMSHANPYAMNRNVRNKTDEQMKALAEKDGVMGIYAWTPASWLKEGVRPTVLDYIEMVDYATKVMGVDHVGIGLDVANFEPVDSFYEVKAKYPEIFPAWVTYENKCLGGLESQADITNVTRGLVYKGFSDQEIAKILGGNFLRLFKRVWGS